jgi:hypothetical protein
MNRQMCFSQYWANGWICRPMRLWSSLNKKRLMKCSIRPLITFRQWRLKKFNDAYLVNYGQRWLKKNIPMRILVNFGQKTVKKSSMRIFAKFWTKTADKKCSVRFLLNVEQKRRKIAV